MYVTSFVLAADQITKLLARGIRLGVPGIEIGGISPYTSKNIIGDFLTLTYVQNPGMAFGFEFGWRSIFAIFSTIGSILIFLYLYFVRDSNRITRFSLALILGGALGNWIDRVFYGLLFDGTSLFQGRVVDFIGLNIPPVPFVFNLADASLTFGIVLLLISYWNDGKQKELEAAENGRSSDGPTTRRSGTIDPDS